MNQYFYAGDLDAVGAGDPTETLAFLAAIQENETVNAGNALACTAAACATSIFGSIIEGFNVKKSREKKLNVDF